MKQAVLLLAHGAPDSLDQIDEYLLNVRGGRPLPPPVVEEIRHRYALIGGRSPLLDLTRREAQALQDLLALPVYIGMRNWSPYIRDTIVKLAADGISHAVAICMAPQYSNMSVGFYFRRTREALDQTGAAIDISWVESFHQHPLLIAAFADRLRTLVDGLQPPLETPQPHPEGPPPQPGSLRPQIDGLQPQPGSLQPQLDGLRPQIEGLRSPLETPQPPLDGRRLPVLFTAHSLPEKVLASGDPYDAEVHATAAGVARELGLAHWDFAYQSQGLTEEKWLGPTVESRLDAFCAEGIKDVVLAPIGFVCDHVEILYDVDILFRNYAAQRGITLHRPESLNDSPLFIRALAEVARERLR